MDKEMRDLVTVIDQLLEVIPKTEYLFRDHINSVRESAMYSSPEAVGHHWNRGAIVLATYVPEPKEEWELEMQAIWCNTKPK